MKIIQTFWSGHPNTGDNPFGLKAGWLSSEYHWMSWALSCLQLRKFYPEVELITDNIGKEILIGALNLPYTNVSAVLESSLDKYPAELWSLAKIFSYRIQEEPFIHLDGDIFLWEPLDEKFVNAGVCAQNLEINLPYYEQSIKEIDSHFSFFPAGIKQLIEKDSTLYAGNTGIFGGKDIQFIRSYCDIAFEFIDKNFESLNKIDKVNLNFIFEQCFLYYLAKSRDRSISYLMKEPVIEPSYMDYANFIDVPQVKMIHTVGGYKRMEIICDHLAKRLRKDYPGYYYDIISLCKQNNIKLKNPVYYFPMFNENNKIPVQPPELKYLNNEREPVAGRAKNKFSKTFFRTIAGLKYTIALNPQNADDFPMPESREILYANIWSLNENDLTERLKEIFALENQKNELTEKLKDVSFTYLLYREDMINYEQTENLFSKAEPEILGYSIFTSASIKLMELNWNWNYNSKLTVEAFIEKKFREEPSVGQAALVSNPLKLSVDEIYLDQIDMVIVNNCVDRILIKDALQLMIQYFDPVELKDGYEDYQKLILDSIKRLMYAGILCAIN